MSGSDNTGPQDGTGREPENGAGDGPVQGAGFGARSDEFGDGGYGDGGDAPIPFDDPDETDADQLLLSDEPASLPWLESDDDEDEADGYDAGQLVSLVMLGMLALALIVGGIWWATRKGADPELVADGSVVEAPQGAYKERPKDPGGMTFEGTGDTSFAVSQGQSRPARLGEGDGGGSPQPGFATVDKAGTAGTAGSAGTGTSAGAAAGAKPAAGAATAPAAGAAAGAQAPAASGVGVQVGAYSTKAAAEAGWSKLAQQHSALSGVRYRIVEGKADIGTVFRLQAVAADGAGARALCGRLKAGGVACQVKN